MLAIPVNPSDHIRGPTSARVTVVAYADFECPYCQQANGAVKIMLERYAERVRFVFRHFPLVAWHSNAELAAEAAEAAGAQGKFWAMVDLLYEHQRNLKEEALRKHAASLELDLVRYDAEMKDRVYLQRIREHQDGGVRSQVRATPTFFVDGEMQDVTFGMQHLVAAIDRHAR